MVQGYLRQERRFIFLAVLGLTLLGALMVYESSSLYAFKVTGDAAYYFKRQAVFMGMGLLLFLLVLAVDIDFLRIYSREILAATFLLLVFVLIVGKQAGGAKRWFQLFGVGLQPSELLKISFLIFCADYFVRKGELIKDVKKGLMPLAALVGGISVLLLAQPDLGTAAFWMIWLFCFLCLHQAKTKHLSAMVLTIAAVIMLLIVVSPYRFRRLTGYLDPFADPKGSGFQLVQSQIAYGEGGIFGVGLGQSRQKLFFLPAAHTDFIYAIIAEEFGIIGSLGLLFVFFILFRKMATVAQIAQDPFRQRILWGIIMILFLETGINIGVTCGLLPTKGMSLPFISYGGSNLVVHYILLGLFFNASRPDKQFAGLLPASCKDEQGDSGRLIEGINHE